MESNNIELFRYKTKFDLAGGYVFENKIIQANFFEFLKAETKLNRLTIGLILLVYFIYELIINSIDSLLNKSVLLTIMSISIIQLTLIYILTVFFGHKLPFCTL